MGNIKEVVKAGEGRFSRVWCTGVVLGWKNEVGCQGGEGQGSNVEAMLFSGFYVLRARCVWGCGERGSAHF